MLMFYDANFLLIIAAVIPAALLMLFIYRMDKLEKEPTVLLWSLIAQGVIAVALASFTERLGLKIMNSVFRNENGVLYRLIFYFLVVGLSEEGFKYILLKRRTWKSTHFNCRFDGIVYAMFVALGFAVWENIDYVVTYGMQVAMRRAITAVPGHACFGAFMGVWYGAAKANENNGSTENSAFCRKMALIVPVLLHGLYDFLATMNPSGEIGWIFIVFVIIMFIGAFATVKSFAKSDHYID